MTTRNAASMGNYNAAWQAGGYCGRGNVESLIDSIKGCPAVVVGSAHTVFVELDYALKRAPDAVIFAVNDIGMFLPKIDHWVSLHSDNLGAWKQVRWLQQRNMESAKYHCPDPRPVVDYAWEALTPLFCLSGYFAMQIAHIMGADRIILCGCPGSPARRFFEAAPRIDFGYGDASFASDDHVQEQVTKEMERLPEFKAKVRSTSGWTRDFFGHPNDA